MSEGIALLIFGEAGWRVSKPIGGRMLDIDAILTEDEQCDALAQVNLDLR